MTNLEKMNELIGSKASIDEIKTWAYRNRIMIADLFEEEKFSTMRNSVDDFLVSDFYFENVLDEHKLWEEFLKRKFIK